MGRGKRKKNSPMVQRLGSLGTRKREKEKEKEREKRKREREKKRREKERTCMMNLDASVFPAPDSPEMITH
jgi:hypothetical protein